MRKGLLFPELGEDATAEFHSLQRLLGYLHLAVNDVQSALYLLQLLWAQVRVSTQPGTIQQGACAVMCISAQA
jgi:hypothetical protein